MYTEKHAETLKNRAGQKWQPSNGQEGDLFICSHCLRCEKWDEEAMCEIMLLTMAFDVEDEEYPKEWVYSKEGQPTCTAFEPSK